MVRIAFARPKVGLDTPEMFAIGIMSGTSCDGVDAVLLEMESPSARAATVVAHQFEPYPADVRRRLLAPKMLSLPEAFSFHRRLPRLYAACVQTLLSKVEMVQAPDISVVGCHGQTVLHRPPSCRNESSDPKDESFTIQLGCGATLASLLGIPVVADFRAADIALGGEGAPIAPVAHWQLTPPECAGRVVVNVGGIANITIVRERLEDVFASDVGVGMMWSDAIAQRYFERPFDRDGAIAAEGRVVPEALAAALEHPFFARVLPSSTGRSEFGESALEPWLRRFVHEQRTDPRDALRTSLAFAAEGIVRSLEERSRLRDILVSGGGAKNPVLLEEIRARVALPVHAVDDGPFAPSHHEPVAMALIALRTLAGLASGIPNATGASRAAVLGALHRPAF